LPVSTMAALCRKHQVASVLFDVTVSWFAVFINFPAAAGHWNTSCRGAHPTPAQNLIESGHSRISHKWPWSGLGGRTPGPPPPSAAPKLANTTELSMCGGDAAFLSKYSDHLRPAETRALQLVLRRTRTVLGAKDLAVSSAVVWKSLPAVLQVTSLTAATFVRITRVCLSEQAHLITFSLAVTK